MIWIWAGFILFVLLMLALDLGVFHRDAHVVSIREALGWSAVWVSLGLAFGVFVYFGYEHHWMGLGLAVDAVDGQVNDGATATVKYLTGYVIEKSLSVDNVFVIAMIFAFMAVPRIYQHRVLFWGILGALVMRGVMIAVGAELIARYHWILYVFGAFLLVTAVKMLVIREHSDPAQSIAVRWAKRWLPVTDQFHGKHFLVRAGSAQSREAATPGDAPLPDAAIDRDDVVAECVLGALQAAPRWRPGMGTTFQAWIYRYARWAGKRVYERFEPRMRHTAHEYRDDDPRRRPPVHFSAIEDPLEVLRVLSDDRPLTVMQEALLRAALSRLDAVDRRIVALHLGAEMPLYRVAIAVGLSYGQARGRLRRAIGALRAYAGEEMTP